MTFRFQFSGDLVRTRQAKGWTQMDVSNLIDLSLREYQNIEGGKCVPGAEIFLKLVFLFELDIERYREGLAVRVPVSSG